jgi:hypothetical protein
VGNQSIPVQDLKAFCRVPALVTGETRRLSLTIPIETLQLVDIDGEVSCRHIVLYAVFGGGGGGVAPVLTNQLSCTPSSAQVMVLLASNCTVLLVLVLVYFDRAVPNKGGALLLTVYVIPSRAPKPNRAYLIPCHSRSACCPAYTTSPSVEPHQTPPRTC